MVRTLDRPKLDLCDQDGHAREIGLDQVMDLLAESYGDLYIGNSIFRNATVPNLTSLQGIVFNDNLLAVAGLINNRIATIGTTRSNRYRPALLVRALEISAAGEDAVWISVSPEKHRVTEACRAAGYGTVDIMAAKGLIAMAPLVAEKFEIGEYDLYENSNADAVLVTKFGDYEQLMFVSD